MPNKPWTKAELEILLNAKNKKRVKIPNRPKKSIRYKLLSLGLYKPKFKIKFHHKRAWTENEINILKSSSNPREAKIPGRSRRSIIMMAFRLRILKKKFPKRTKWNRRDEKLLINLAKEGKNSNQISKLGVFSKPYSKDSISKKLLRLGLSKDNVKRIIFPKNILIKFKKFLQENYEGKTPKELTDLWNQQNSFKIKKNKVIYHLTAMNIKISHLEVKAIINLRKKEEKIKKMGGTAKFVEESLRRVRADIMRERISSNKDIWTGAPLKKEE